MKTKLDHYNLSILINGLYTMRDQYDSEKLSQINDLLLRLIDIHESLKPKRKARIIFSGTELHIVHKCLIDWRNQFLREGKLGAAECVGELILLVSGQVSICAYIHTTMPS